MLLRFILIMLSQTVTEPALTGDSLLYRIESGFRTIEIDGRLSTTGKQTFSGMPFSVVMDSSHTYLLTMGGPFGLTAAKMVATDTSFVMVNYLQQEVWEGDPRSPSLASASHLPIPASDLMDLMRGRIPGDLARFVRTAPERTDGTVLFVGRDSSSIEYVLVDSVKNTLRQYQRKDQEGTLLMDVAFQDVREINGHYIPHRIAVATKERAETATVDIVDVEVNGTVKKITPPPTSSSFSRRTFR